MDEQMENETVEVQPDPKQEVQNEPAVQPEAEKPPKKKELSKGRRVWRKFLLWLTLIAVVFLAGVLTLNYVRLQPTLRELTQAYQTIADLEGQVSDLTAQLAAAESTSDSLQGADAHREFLQVQLDISSARLALEKGDVEAAKGALSETTKRLQALIPEIKKVDAGLSDSLPQRLSLVLSGLDGNVDNAAVDLGLLADDLQNLVDTLFSK
ncbi:MAG: hypothetical protein ACK2TS_00690 [Anaerolineales bacterium]